MTVFDKLAAAKPWIPSRLTFLVRHGSNAYGTNVEGSDEDFKGALVAPKECYLGFRDKFEQQTLSEPDTVVYEIKKFFSLAAACNPNIIEVLHVDPTDRIYSTAAGDKIFEAKDKFLSKKVRYTFAGYAASQLGRIETHRRWLLDPPKVKPERKDFKLPEKTLVAEDQLLAAKAEIKKEVEKYNLGFLDLREDQMIAVQNTMYDMLGELHITKDDMWAGSARKVGLSENFIEYMQKERQYEGKIREWGQFQDWKRDRNIARSILEEKYGYDTKHAYHLVRLIRMCKEILETGKVIVKRPDREELLFIRNGGWSYDQLIEYAKFVNKQLDEICGKSKIADTPDMNYLNNLCIEIIESML
jgi:predicted nucleotidyltransferase